MRHTTVHCPLAACSPVSWDTHQSSKQRVFWPQTNLQKNAKLEADSFSDSDQCNNSEIVHVDMWTGCNICPDLSHYYVTSSSKSWNQTSREQITPDSKLKISPHLFPVMLPGMKSRLCCCNPVFLKHFSVSFFHVVPRSTRCNLTEMCRINGEIYLHNS